MGKQKQKKSQPTAQPEVQQTDLISKIEDSVAGTAQGLSSTVKTHKTTLIGATVVVIALIPIYYIVKSVGLKNRRAESHTIVEAFTGEPAEIRSQASELLQKMKGKNLEPAAAVKYCNWLIQEGDNPTKDREEALRVAKDVQSRHPDDPFLQHFLDQTQGAIAADEGFTVPAPPEPVGPAPDDASEDTASGSNETTIEVIAPNVTTQPASSGSATTQPGGG